MFEFKGTIGPPDIIPPFRAGYSLNRPQGSVSIEVDEHAVSIRFVASYESFDDLYYQTFEFALAFFAVGTITTGLAVELRLDEWFETYLDRTDEEGKTQRIRGQIFHEDPEAKPSFTIPEDYAFALAQGIQWSEDIAESGFLRRAILDFNHALKHPLNDIPIYLARALESIENYYGGEQAMMGALGVSPQAKLIKKIANDALGGLHTRHAAKTEQMIPLTKEQVIPCVEATRDVLQKFQMFVMTNRFKRQTKK